MPDAPDAVQVSDRFHLWQGLGRKVYEVVAHAASTPRCASCWSRRWRYARAPTWPKRTGIVAPYQSFLHRRWAEGQHNIAALHREIAGQGSGSEGTVRLYVTDHQERKSCMSPEPHPCAFHVTARPRP